MLWEQIGESWRQLKDKVTFRHIHDADATPHNELIGPRAWRSEQDADPQTIARHADAHYQRREFSQHISC
jgi:hypothetical protein